MQSQYSKHSTPATILFTHYGDEWIRGSERCLLDLLTHINRNLYNPVVWCNSDAMADEVQRLNIPVILSEFPLLFGWQRPRLNIKAFYRLIKQGIRLVDEYNVTLIHANSGAPTQWLNLVARSRHTPLITHLHSRYPLRDRITLGLHQVTKIVGVSKPVINQLLQDGISPASTCVIPNGIDSNRLNQQKRVDLRRQLNLSENDFLLVTTASLMKRKGIDLLIDATARLIKQGIPARLAIIGEGPERQNLQQQIQRLNIQNQVHLLGEKSNVGGLLRGGVDLFVSAAREEVFGLVLAEAGLARLAVIAPAVGGIPDVVVDGKTGLLVPAENVLALTLAISHLYHKPHRRKQMGNAGYQHVIKNFTIEENTKNFENLYQQMLNNPNMRMCWYSHWKLVGLFKSISKQLLTLLIKKYHSAVIT